MLMMMLTMMSEDGLLGESAPVLPIGGLLPGHCCGQFALVVRAELDAADIALHRR
jgi:hypothetical protein